MTRFGQRDALVHELLAEAEQACLEDAGVSPDAVEHLYVSNMASGEFEGQTGYSPCILEKRISSTANSETDPRYNEDTSDYDRQSYLLKVV